MATFTTETRTRVASIDTPLGKGYATITTSVAEVGQMSQHRSETPFDNIESSHEFVSLLAEAVRESLADVEADMADAKAAGALRRVEALQLVHFNLTKLAGNMSSSSRILNDLRTLRRLLLEERSLARAYRQAAG